MEFILARRASGEQFITVFDEYLEQPLIADDSHPNFDEIVEVVTSGIGDLGDLGELIDLFDVSRAVERAFTKISERVAVNGGAVYFDGDEIHGAITEQILRFLDEGEDVTALVAFLEKLSANPSERSREQLYEWLDRHDFAITKSGDIVAYKGVTDDLRSIHRGRAVVNGREVNGAVPNEVGAVVEFPRSEVADDPAVGCSRGLHAGTWDYARSFSRGKVLEVHVNPRDVVSVPTDCDAQKVRVCRYRVVRVLDGPHTGALVDDYEALDDYVEDRFGHQQRSAADLF